MESLDDSQLEDKIVSFIPASYLKKGGASLEKSTVGNIG